MSSRESYPGEGAVGSLAALAVLLLLVATVICLWLTIKFLELVVRQLVAHPRCKPLWAAVIGWCVLSSAAVVTFGAEAWLNALAVLSALVLLVTAKVVELSSTCSMSPGGTWQQPKKPQNRKDSCDGLPNYSVPDDFCSTPGDSTR